MKTHYAYCERAHEGDNMDYWDDETACGLNIDEHDELDVTDKYAYATCKNCLRVLNKNETNG